MFANQGISAKGGYWYFRVAPSLVGVGLWGVQVCLGTTIPLPGLKVRLSVKQPVRCTTATDDFISSWHGVRFRQHWSSVAGLRGPVASFLPAGLWPVLREGF